MDTKTHDCKEELNAAGYRATPGRLKLLSVLEHARQPLSVRDILERSSGRLLDPVNLYRALESFADRGLLRKGMRDGVVHYEYAAKPHHHHLVCSDCGFSKTCATC